MQHASQQPNSQAPQFTNAANAEAYRQLLQRFINMSTCAQADAFKTDLENQVDDDPKDALKFLDAFIETAVPLFSERFIKAAMLRHKPLSEDEDCNLRHWFSIILHAQALRGSHRISWYSKLGKFIGRAKN